MNTPQTRAMRVLLAHNFYRSSAPSGEDEVVRSEQRLLLENGVEVIPFVRHNDDLAPALRRAGCVVLERLVVRVGRRCAECSPSTGPTSPISTTRFRRSRPPLMTPAAKPECRWCRRCTTTACSAPMGCSTAPANPAKSASGRAPMPALIHGCYRDSRVATAGMMLGTPCIARAAPTRPWWTASSRSRIRAKRFIAHGIPAERITVRGNCLASDPGVGRGAGGYALFVGRLTAEKGVRR